MKKILIVIDSLGYGGAEKVLYTYLQHWDTRKYSITVVPIVDTGVYSSKVKKMTEISYSPVISSSSNYLKNIFNKILYKLVYQYLPANWVYTLFIPKNHDIEIAFCEGFVTKLISKSSNKKAKKIAWIHTDLVTNNWPLSIGVFKDKTEEIGAYAAYDSIVGVSQLVCDGFKDSFGLSNISCIYNPLDKKEINELASKTVINNSSKAIRLVSVGRLVYDKGYDLLVQSISILISRGIIVDLTIIGEGAMRNQLEKLIHDLGITEHVHLLGFKDNPYQYMKEADIYISSSRFEGFSLAIAEAMILGLPVISTKCAGPLELLDNGSAGMMVECTTESIANGIYEMVTHPEILELYRDKSKERQKYFSIENSIHQTNQLFEK